MGVNLPHSAPARPNRAIGYCDRYADDLIERYEEVRFEDVHGDLLAWLPTPPARVLDVGAGSGRDAKWLAAHGFVVTAVEPSISLRNWGQTQTAQIGVQWIDDRLPALPRLKRIGTRYDFILASAVLMFLPRDDRIASVDSMLSLLVPKGRLAMTVRLGSAEPRRGLYAMAEPDLARLTDGSQSARVVYQDRSSDRWSRERVTWRTVVLEKTGKVRGRSARQHRRP